jgi:hypothetical protein
MKGLSLQTVRRHCLECSGDSFKSVVWCSCDGLHSTLCHLWPFRLGMNPATVCQKYGPGLVTPRMMPSANVNLDDLPSGIEAAAAYVAAGGAAAAG